VALSFVRPAWAHSERSKAQPRDSDHAWWSDKQRRWKLDAGLHADTILRFIADPAVPFSNNVAERAVRMPKVNQRISGCFRAVNSTNNFRVIRSCLPRQPNRADRIAAEQ
jgi:hypothetical protein